MDSSLKNLPMFEETRDFKIVIQKAEEICEIIKVP